MSVKNLQRKIGYWIFLGFTALYVLSMGGHGYGGVGTTTYDVTRSILLRGSVAIDEVPWGKFGPDGQFYAQYGIGHSLYNIPFYLLGHFFTKLSPALASQYDRLTMLTTLLGQPVISALTCTLLFLLCLQLGYSRDTSLACTCLYGLGTQAWMYAQLDFSEPILTFFLLLSVYCLACATQVRCPGMDSRRRKTDRLEAGQAVCSFSEIGAFTLAGLFSGMAMSVKIVAVIVLPLFYLFIISSPDGKVSSVLKRCLAFSVPLGLVGFGAVGSYNFLRFGTPFETGYGDEFTFYYRDVMRQFGDNLWSFEGSIVFYSPVIVCGVFGAVRFYRRFKRFALLVFGMVASFFLFYPFTTNELYYGPRYLTPTLPFFMLIAGSWIETLSSSRLKQKFRYAVIIFLFFLGSVQQVVGVVVNYHTYYWRIQYALPAASQETQESERAQMLRETPKLAHLAGHFWLVSRVLRGFVHDEGMPIEGVLLSSKGDSVRRNNWVPYYGLDLWWCHRQLISRFGLIFPLVILSGLGSILYLSYIQVQKIRRLS